MPAIKCYDARVRPCAGRLTIQSVPQWHCHRHESSCAQAPALRVTSSSRQRALHPEACLQREHRPAKECASIVEECQGLRQTYYACKRGQVDNTKRIRGNKGY